jgi:hypothetical protein
MPWGQYVSLWLMPKLPFIVRQRRRDEKRLAPLRLVADAAEGGRGPVAQQKLSKHVCPFPCHGIQNFRFFIKVAFARFGSKS